MCSLTIQHTKTVRKVRLLSATPYRPAVRRNELTPPPPPSLSLHNTRCTCILLAWEHTQKKLKFTVSPYIPGNAAWFHLQHGPTALGCMFLQLGLDRRNDGHFVMILPSAVLINLVSLIFFLRKCLQVFLAWFWADNVNTAYGSSPMRDGT
jgi:hypothetical protein